MKKYKAIICDIDGTIIENGSNPLPSEKVKNAIQEAQKRGAIFCLATARSIHGAAPIIDFLELDSLSILNNGATIYNLQTKQPVWGSYLPVAESNEILAILGQYKKHTKISSTTGLFPDLNHIPDDLNVAKIAIFKLSLEEINRLEKDISQKFKKIQAVRALADGEDHVFDLTYITQPSHARRGYKMFSSPEGEDECEGKHIGI